MKGKIMAKNEPSTKTSHIKVVRIEAKNAGKAGGNGKMHVKRRPQAARDL